MSTTIEPIWSASADEVWWRFWQQVRPEWNQQCCDWLLAEGMDPMVVKAVEVYLVDTLHGEITEYVKDDQGRVMVDPEADRALTRTYTRLLSSHPPQWPQVIEEGE